MYKHQTVDDPYLEKENWELEKKYSSIDFQQRDFNVELGNNEIDCIQRFMCYHVSEITSSQLRNVFSLILDNSSFTAKRIKIAYIAGRTQKSGMTKFLNKIDTMLEKDTISKDLIKKFTEACVAYHKYYESGKSF